MPEEIVFDASLYLPDAVVAAAAAYSGHMRVELTQTADAVVARLSGLGDDDPRALVDAFCNHALYETIVRRRQAALLEESS
jgi:hypothetical protein